MLSKEELQLLFERIEDYLYEVNEEPEAVPFGMTLHEHLLCDGYDESLIHKLGIFDRC